MNSHKDKVQSFIERIPFASQFNISVQNSERGRLRLELLPKPSHFNHFGTYQAGVLFMISEVTGGAMCGTFLDLTKNLLITKRSEIDFIGNSSERIVSEAIMKEEMIDQFLENLATKKKMNLQVEVLIKSNHEQLIVRSVHDYYVRLNIPRLFKIQ